MKIQVNSDSTIAMEARLGRFVEGEVRRVLDRFADKLTRVELHLSDVDNQKTGRADKRCLIEVRPAGAKPLSASAKAMEVSSAVSAALGKMQRSLTTFFGRRGRAASAASGSASPAKKAAAKKSAVKKAASGATKKVAVKAPEAPTPTTISSHGPKKKRIYQARRKAWPAR